MTTPQKHSPIEESEMTDSARGTDDQQADREGDSTTEQEATSNEEFATADEESLSAEDSSTEELDPVSAAQAKAAEYLALAQRTQADFENYRKRVARDAAQGETRGISRITKELLSALDHFEIALRQIDSDGGDHDEIVKGFRLVHDELIGALERVGVKPFSPEGEPFDPNEHEAMAQQPSDKAESGTVIEVYQRGYRIDGLVLRPARVVVAA